jgi:hypothetical protein
VGKEIRLMVTQPVHGSHGDLIHQPGEMFPLGTELGPDVRVSEVIVDVPDAPEARPAKDVSAAGHDSESPAGKGDDGPADPAPAAARPSPPPARPGGSRGTRSSSS